MPLSNEKALTIAKEWLDNKGKGVTEKQWNDWEIMKSRNHKYRRKIFYNEYKVEIGKIIRELCECKNVNII